MIFTNGKKRVYLVYLLYFLFISNFIYLKLPYSNKNSNSIINHYLNGLNINLFDNGFIDNENNKLFWFAVISDTQFLWYDSEKLSQFYQFLNESFKTIKPTFIYHTGDIVDADNGNQQRIEEWQYYNQSLYDNNMNSTIYMDIMGNHDSVADPDNSYFLNYSMMGKSYGVLQYSFNRSFSFGDYAFIGLNTAKDEYFGAFDFAFLGYLDTQELDWYENELKKYSTCKAIFTFGHHPISYPPFNYLLSNKSTSGKDFFQLNNKYNVLCYFAGHAHANFYQEQNQTFSIVTTKFDDEGGTYRIIAIDHNEISSSIEHIGEWPQGIITSPPRSNYPYTATENINDTIRVLAWDPKGVISVQWAIFNITDNSQLTEWQNLENIYFNNPLWQDSFSYKEPGEYLLKILINGGSGTSMREIHIYIPINPTNYLFELILIIIILTIAFIGIAFIIVYYKRRTNLIRSKTNLKG